MEKETGLKLIPTYSYCRLYKKGNVCRKRITCIIIEVYRIN